MTQIEDEIRELFVAEEARTPPTPPFSRIQRGLARSRRRRVGAAAGVAVAAATAITVPVALPRAHQSVGPAPAHKPTVQNPPGMSRVMTLAPGWLPAGLVETERFGQLRGDHIVGDRPTSFTGRAFAGQGDKEVLVMDADRSEAPQTGTTPIRVGKRAGLAWIDKTTKSYQIEVPWRPGHWLDVNTAHFADNNATALRVAGSVVERRLTLGVPITCSECTSLNVFSVTGTPDDAYTLMYGPSLEINVDNKTSGQGATQPLGHGFYGHFTSLPQSKRPLSTAQLIAIAKTARLAEKPDYSYLGKRP